MKPDLYIADRLYLNYATLHVKVKSKYPIETDPNKQIVIELKLLS